MPFVILGLLMSGPLSLYDVRKRFAAGISLFYSASFGALQRALRQLVTDGHATVTDDDGSARGRKLYALTPEGRRAWRDWMHAPLTSGTDAETTVLAKVFLLGRLEDAAERSDVLAALRLHVLGAADVLRDLERELDAAQPPADLREVAAFQRATLDYGLRSHSVMLDWLDELAVGAPS